MDGDGGIYICHNSPRRKGGIPTDKNNKPIKTGKKFSWWIGSKSHALPPQSVMLTSIKTDTYYLRHIKTLNTELSRWPISVTTIGAQVGCQLVGIPALRRLSKNFRSNVRISDKLTIWADYGDNVFETHDGTVLPKELVMNYANKILKLIEAATADALTTSTAKK